MLYRNSTDAIDHPSGYAYASIDNIQFSPKGDKVYFEIARWVTSAALNVMNPDGSNGQLSRKLCLVGKKVIARTSG